MAEALLAVEHIARAVFLRRRRDVGEIVARLPLDMRECEQRFAGRDLGQQLGRHGIARPMAQETTPSTTVARYGSSAEARGRTPPSRSWSSTGPPPMPP
jgi:hypothetical protein